MPDRATYVDTYAAGFDRSLKRLGPAAAAQVAAELQSFMRAWRRGDSAMDLNRSWTFKPIQGEDGTVLLLGEGGSRAARVASRRPSE